MPLHRAKVQGSLDSKDQVQFQPDQFKQDKAEFRNSLKRVTQVITGKKKKKKSLNMLFWGEMLTHNKFNMVYLDSKTGVNNWKQLLYLSCTLDDS